MSIDTTTKERALSHAPTNLPAALLAFGLGAFLIVGAGFVSAETLHDTAHDVRHSLGFPCH